MSFRHAVVVVVIVGVVVVVEVREFEANLQPKTKEISNKLKVYGRCPSG